MEEQPLLSDGYVKKIKKPKKVKDHTVLANLVIVFSVCPFVIDRNWLKIIMVQSTQYPEVSGFYKLLSKTLDQSQEFFQLGFFDHAKLQTVDAVVVLVLELLSPCGFQQRNSRIK